jgi:integrase
VKTTTKKTGKLPSGLYWHGKTIWCQYRHDGKTIRESTGCVRKDDALLKLNEKRVASGKGTLVVGAHNVRFEDLVKLVTQYYASEGKKTTPYVSKALATAFGGLRVEAITTERIRQYKIDRVEQGVSLSTAKAELRYLRQGFRLALDAERVAKMPKFGDLQAATRSVTVTEDDLPKIMKCLPGWARPIVMFCYITGWRVGSGPNKGEVLNLKWSNVDWPAKLVRLDLGTTKNGEGRTFPFAEVPALKTMLAAQQAARSDSEWVFPIPGASCPDLRYRKLRKAFRAACRAAKVKGPNGEAFRLHDLRRAAVRNFSLATVSRNVGKALSGHKTEGVYDDYAGADIAAQRVEVTKLAGLLAPTLAKVEEAVAA